MPWSGIIGDVNQVVVPIILPHGPKTIDVGMVQIEERVGRAPVGTHVP